MTWRSAINDYPKFDEDLYVDEDQYNDQYYEWLEKVMAEPWVQALEHLIRWTKLWVGTEEQLIEEIKIRVGKEVSASPDFPSSYDQLDEYIRTAIEGFQMKDLEVMHYRELDEEDLEDFDVPGWGPEAPIVVFEGDAARRPEYWEVMCRFLTYEQALPLAVLIFTAEDKHFRKWRMWTGTIKQLIKKLKRHLPHVGPVPYRLARHFWTRDDGSYDYWFMERSFNFEPIVNEDYLGVSKLMRTWSSILEEARIKVSWEKRTISARSPETDKINQKHRTYWTIEAPRWYKPDDMFGYDASEKDIYPDVVGSGSVGPSAS
jgi:hypothetical protein